MIRRALAALVLAGALGLTGCAGTVTGLEPAENANDPACADVIVRLPQTVDGQQRRWTDAQATGAWGDPASVILTCGLESVGPTTLQCQTVDGVDWVIDDTNAPKYRFTTFGRTPALEVYLDYGVVSARQVLDDLGTAVGTLPSNGSACTDRPAQ